LLKNTNIHTKNDLLIGHKFDIKMARVDRKSMERQRNII
jgi:hypothetical protein